MGRGKEGMSCGQRVREERRRVFAAAGFELTARPLHACACIYTLMRHAAAVTYTQTHTHSRTWKQLAAMSVSSSTDGCTTSSCLAASSMQPTATSCSTLRGTPCVVVAGEA